MPRFVVLDHKLPPNHERESHWDFMLQDNEHLLTWALEKSPLDSTTSNAIQLPNHRLAYLTEEGPVSNNRGTVRRIDDGEYEWITRQPDRIEVRLAGEQLVGVIRLQRQIDAHWHWESKTREDLPRDSDRQT